MADQHKRAPQIENDGILEEYLNDIFISICNN